LKKLGLKLNTNYTRLHKNPKHIKSPTRLDIISSFSQKWDS